MRWKNGGPPKVYALVMNKDSDDIAVGTVMYFESRKQRTQWVTNYTPTYADGTYTFLTYIQEEK